MAVKKESYVLGSQTQAQCSAGVTMSGIPPTTQSEPGFTGEIVIIGTECLPTFLTLT